MPAEAGKSSSKSATPRVVYFSYSGYDQGSEDGWSYMAIKKEPNDTATPSGVCVPPPTSLMTTQATSDGPAPAVSFAQSLANMMAASRAAGAASCPAEPTPRLDEPVRGRAMAPGPKTYSYSPTSEVESNEDESDEFENSLPDFLKRNPNGDAALLREALGSGATEVVHDALQCLNDMEVGSLGVATAVYLPPNAHIINPAVVLPPLEALQERHMDQLNEWLAANSPQDPRYAEAYLERWNEFQPVHLPFTQQDAENLLRWHKNMLAGYRPELQLIPEAKALPAPPKEQVAPASTTAPSGSADGSSTCAHRRITRKGTNQHFEKETCLDRHKVLKNVPKGSTNLATGSANAANAAQQAACNHPRISWKGSNGHQWRNTCMTCGKVVTGYFPHKTPGAGQRPKPSSTTEPRAIGSFPIDKVEEIFQMCHVIARLKAADDNSQQLPAERLHKILDVVMVTTSSSSTSPLPSSTGSGADEKGQKILDFGEFRGRSFMDVFQNDKRYVDWCLTPTTESSRNSSPTSSARLLHVLALWQLMEEDLRMALIAILDLGCNRACHGDRWLQRYMHAVDQHHYPLKPDHGGGFRGIGGSVNTKGLRSLDVCFEIEDGMAVGEIDSIELEDSDAPLLLSISDQRRPRQSLQCLFESRAGCYQHEWLAWSATSSQASCHAWHHRRQTASDLQVMSNEATSTTQLPLLEPLTEPYSERQLAATGTQTWTWICL